MTEAIHNTKYQVQPAATVDWSLMEFYWAAWASEIASAARSEIEAWLKMGVEIVQQRVLAGRKRSRVAAPTFARYEQS